MWSVPWNVSQAIGTLAPMDDFGQPGAGMTSAEIKAGIASGTLERGTVEREAEGLGLMPLVGDFLDPEKVRRINPPLSPTLHIVALEVVGLGYGWSASTTKWRVPVVAIRSR